MQCTDLKYQLLNAKPENVERESEIVGQSGRKGAITIATNMAGRGTDIILGGNPDYMARCVIQSTVFRPYFFYFQAFSKYIECLLRVSIRRYTFTGQVLSYNRGSYCRARYVFWWKYLMSAQRFEFKLKVYNVCLEPQSVVTYSQSRSCLTTELMQLWGSHQFIRRFDFTAKPLMTLELFFCPNVFCHFLNASSVLYIGAYNGADWFHCSKVLQLVKDDAPI